MMVKYSYGQKSAELLSSLNPSNHTFKTYNGLGHSSDPRVSLHNIVHTCTCTCTIYMYMQSCTCTCTTLFIKISNLLLILFLFIGDERY